MTGNGMKILKSLFLAVLWASLYFFFSLPLSAGIESKGEVTLETRAFTNDGKSETRDHNIALFARLESRLKKGPFRAAFRAFGRVDKDDPGRSVLGLEEAWLGYRKRGWDIRAGVQMLNWTATEAFHPADMMNSRNLDSDIENQEKLGELMFSVKRRIGRGDLTAYIMPRYAAPIFPSSSSRVSFLPTGMDTGEALWLEPDGGISGDSYGFQWGARFTQTVGPADFSVHVLEHQDRYQPVVLADGAAGRLYPVYLPVRDIGGTYLQVLGAWIVKVEFNHRHFKNPGAPVDTGFAGGVLPSQPDHAQLALGLEYGWTYGNGGDGTVILEGQGFFGVNREERAALHPFQRDLLVGYRHSWNDVLSKELLITAIFDVERKNEFLLSASYKQRLNDTWGVTLGLRIVNAPPKKDVPVGLEGLHKSNQIYMTLSRYF